MKYHKLNKLEFVGLLIALGAVLVLVGYNVGLSAQKACTGDLQRFSDGSLYCVRDLGKVTEDSQ